MDVILTVSFKLTAEIDLQNLCFGSYFADEDVYWRFVKHNYVLSFIHCHGMRLHFFFTVKSSVNAPQSSLKGICWRKFHGKGIKLMTFPQGYIQCNQPFVG